MNSLCTINQSFRTKNALLKLMDQIGTPSQVNGLFMHFTLDTTPLISFTSRIKFEKSIQ